MIFVEALLYDNNCLQAFTRDCKTNSGHHYLQCAVAAKATGPPHRSYVVCIADS